MKKIIGLTARRVWGLIFALGLTAAAYPGGAKDEGRSSAGKDTARAAITVISREDGSGTRSAFIELFGILDNNKVDNTSPRAEITNNTAVMMTSVAGDPNAIGYISLGSLNNTVKAVKVNGVEATAANVANGSYIVSRPFNIVVKGTVSPAAQDFINFIMSQNGQDLIEKNHYIRVADSGPFTAGGAGGKLVIAGSSSVTPIMEKIKEAYQALNPKADIAIQQSDSSTGINAVISGICDIGMASRELKSSETEKGVVSTVIAMDGIAVIVNQRNPLGDMTKEQVRSIFTGEIANWSALTK